MPNTPTLDKVRELFDDASVDGKVSIALYEWRMSVNIIVKVIKESNPCKLPDGIAREKRSVLRSKNPTYLSIACIIVHDEDDVLELSRKG